MRMPTVAEIMAERYDPLRINNQPVKYRIICEYSPLRDGLARLDDEWHGDATCSVRLDKQKLYVCRACYEDRFFRQHSRNEKPAKVPPPSRRYSGAELVRAIKRTMTAATNGEV